MEFTFTKFAVGYAVHFHPTKATFRSDGTYIGSVCKESGGWAGYLPGKVTRSTWRTGGSARLHAAESLAHKVGLVDGDYNPIITTGA